MRLADGLGPARHLIAMQECNIYLTCVINFHYAHRMFGKPQWFRRRKYGGWGLFPATWQGWLYTAIIVALIFGVGQLPMPDEWRMPAMLAVSLVFAADLVRLMAVVASDERERMHEAIAERNAMWAMIVVLCGGVAYQVAASLSAGGPAVDPVVVIALAAALIAKGATNLYLDRKD